MYTPTGPVYKLIQPVYTPTGPVYTPTRPVYTLTGRDLGVRGGQALGPATTRQAEGGGQEGRADPPPPHRATGSEDQPLPSSNQPAQSRQPLLSEVLRPKPTKAPVPCIPGRRRTGTSPPRPGPQHLSSWHPPKTPERPSWVTAFP